MLKKKEFDKKIFAIYIVVSFFFLGIFILVSYLFLEKKVVYVTSLINTTAIKKSEGTSFALLDNTKKRLSKYPAYGSKYATINIPKIDIKLPVYYGDTLKILKYGVGTYFGAFFPGESGTIIMPSHNALDGFGRLPGLEKGDDIIIETTYGTFKYIVDSYKIVKETETSAFPIQDEKEMLILYTCYPINKSVVGRKTLRYVVYAYRGDLNE